MPIYTYTDVHGQGLPDLVLAKSQITKRNFVRSLSIDDEFGDYLRKILLEERTTEAAIDEVIQGYTRGRCDIINEASRSLNRIRKYLQCDLQLKVFEGRVSLEIAGTSYRDPWPTLNSLLQKPSQKELQKAPNQGRYWRTMTETPMNTKAIFNIHTKLCDFRFIHRARLNLVPVRANNVWIPVDNQTCRRCQADRETLNHTLNDCSLAKKKIIQRHNEVRELLTSHLNQRLRVLKEQRFGNMQPDLVIQDEQKKEAYILDIKVSSEAKETFAWNVKQMAEKYDSLRRAYNVSGYATSIHTIRFGNLSNFSRSSLSALRY